MVARTISEPTLDLSSARKKARIEAAAPGMLETLKLLRDGDGLTPSAYDSVCFRYRAAIERAIAEAGGD